MERTAVAIIGGGLAGLTSAIHLRSSGLLVVLFEKEGFPHHKVCGEYLSGEVSPYLENLGISLSTLKPAAINKLKYSTANGNSIDANLPLGGIGISRYALDDHLYQKALERGVEILEETVENVVFKNGLFFIKTISGREIQADIAVGAFGKRSAMDKKLNRDFINKKTRWLAVKGHYKAPDYPEELVSLHNFDGGYCGLSKTETGKVNVCYLATYSSFKKYKNPEIFKEQVLSQNPYLKAFFKDAEPCFEKDLSIAQISFSRKSPVEKNILMIGDSAGLIHPLCGNGMAMAIHSAKIASEVILKFLDQPDFRSEIGKNYSFEWNKEFSSRLRTGRLLQKILMNPALAEMSQSVIRIFPNILPVIITKTHGKPLV